MEVNLRRSTRLLETESTSSSAPASKPIVIAKKKSVKKSSAPVITAKVTEDAKVKSSTKKSGTKAKAKTPTSVKSEGATSRKRRVDDSKPQSVPKTQNKKSKVVANKNAFDLLVEEVEGILATLRDEQKAYAQSQSWSYDPRAEIVTSGLSLHEICLTGLGLEVFDEIVDHIVKQNTYFDDGNNADPPPPLTALENYCVSVTDEISALRNLSEAEAAVFGLNRLFQLVPAKYVSELLATSATAPNTKEEVKELLKTLDIGKLIEAHPHSPYFSDVTVISTEEEDPRDSESSWCEKFYNHMEWLFEQFDAQKCVNLGRIYAALGRPVMELKDEEEVLQKEFMNLALSKLGGTAWRKVAAAARKGDKEDADADAKEGEEEEEEEDHESWRAAPLRVHIAKVALFTFPFSYRTYTGCFAFNIRESDYDGSRVGIADYVADMAEEHFQAPEFIQWDALRNDEEISAAEFVVTEAFYIPGMKSALDDEENENPEEDG